MRHLVAIVVGFAVCAVAPSAGTAAEKRGSHHHHRDGHPHDHAPAKEKKTASKPKAKSRKRSAPAPERHDHSRPHSHEQRVHGHLTEHMFGFTAGSDIGHVGHREAILDTVARFGRRDGSYGAASIKFRIGFTPVENFHLAFGLSGGRHHISGVTGFEDRQRWAFEAFSIEAKSRLIDRMTGPFGLTVVVEPHIAFVEEGNGESVRKQAVEFKLVIDKELVPNKLFGAVNLLYEPERVRARVTGELENESTVGVSAALAMQVHPGMFLGGEVRYLRKYDGLTLNDFVGDALFVGPTAFIRMGTRASLAAAWNVQVAGESVHVPGARFNLDHFTRHHVKVKAVLDF